MLLIEELGLSIPTTDTNSTNKAENEASGALGELLKQPELLSQPIHPLDWSVYNSLLSSTGSLPKKQKL